MSATGSWMCCCQTLTTWRSQWTGGMPKLINPCSSASSSTVCTQLTGGCWCVRERVPLVLEGTSCQCKGQSCGRAPQPHKARTALPRCQQHVWVGDRHPAVPRVAMLDLVVDSARSSVQLLCEGEDKGTDLFLASSWNPHAVSRRHRAVCPSCALHGGCAAAGWDWKADLSLCLLPRGCRAISSFWESVGNFWG